MEICENLPKFCEAEGDKFLYWIIAVDETRFHGVFKFVLESKRQWNGDMRIKRKQIMMQTSEGQSDGHCDGHWEQRVLPGFSEKRGNHLH